MRRKSKTSWTGVRCSPSERRRCSRRAPRAGPTPNLWSSGGNPPPGAGGGTSASTTSGGGASTSNTVTTTSTTSTSVTTTSTTATSSTSGGVTTTSTTATSSTASTSSSTGGMTCTTGANSQRLDFSQYPKLMTTGGSVSFQGNNYSDPACGQPDIIVVAQGGGTFLAFSASCSHQCCTVSWSGTKFRCPCHGATFNTTGACTNGVAPQPLSPLKVCADSTGITVTW